MSPTAIFTSGDARAAAYPGVHGWGRVYPGWGVVGVAGRAIPVPSPAMLPGPIFNIFRLRALPTAK